MAHAKGVTEKSFMEGLLTKGWVALRDTSKDGEVLRVVRAPLERGRPVLWLEHSCLMGVGAFGRGTQPWPTSSPMGQSRK